MIWAILVIDAVTILTCGVEAVVGNMTGVIGGEIVGGIIGGFAGQVVLLLIVLIFHNMVVM